MRKINVEDVRANAWKEVHKKYLTDRDNMTEEEHKSFVEDCFNLYEADGFAKVFWSPYELLDGSPNCEGKPFKVLGRVTAEEVDLEVLPMWHIQFEDGFKTMAYPEEVNPFEMKDRGCKLKI